MSIPSRTLAELFGQSNWKSQWDTFLGIIAKSRPRSNRSAIDHGNRYEKIAIQMYKLNSGNYNVSDINKTFSHPEYKYITGKVDGIITMENGEKVVLEVKCPYGVSNLYKMPEFNVNDFYWVQVQIYMEILNVDKTHFCEYYRFDDNNVFFRWKEVQRDKEWFGSIIDNLDELKRKCDNHSRKRKFDDTQHGSQNKKQKKD